MNSLQPYLNEVGSHYDSWLHASFQLISFNIKTCSIILQWVNFIKKKILPIIVLTDFRSFNKLSHAIRPFPNFYRAAWNADAVLRCEFCPSVRPSVCLSVCQTRALWQNGRKLCLDFYIMVGGDPFYLKFWVNRPALERNRRFWTDNHSKRLSRTT